MGKKQCWIIAIFSFGHGCADVNNIICSFAAALSGARLEDVSDKIGQNTGYENINRQAE